MSLFISTKSHSLIFIIGTMVQNKHDIRVIDVADILFVQSGFIGSRKLEACKSSSLDPSKVISIFHNNSKSMDFQVKNEEDRMTVLNAIQTIRETYHAAKVKVGREELLLVRSSYHIYCDVYALLCTIKSIQITYHLYCLL